MPDTNFPKPGVDFDAGHVPITEEFDSAKRNLPAAAPLIAALIVVVVFIVGVAYIFRATPVAQGQIDHAFAEQQQDNPYSMVLMQVTVRNVTSKPLFIKGIKAEIVTDQGSSVDDAASAVDYGRYLQAFPDLQMYATDPLKVETKIAPGGEAHGSVMVAFPITKDQFYARKDLNVTILPYDQRAIELHEKGAATLPAK
ncbi:MAG TPA: hypothetical protein VE779_14585 [Candidatus Angelobacter sp.]|nr:hypothetical protein [Candidatus Angelobacter sp.]